MSGDKLPQVTFYRATRPQAPRYAKLPHNAGMMECSSCRGLMLPDREEIRRAHRAWHVEMGPMRTSTLTTTDSTPRPYQSCFEVAKLSGHYELIPTCQHCTEDVCPCTQCQVQHKLECAQWAQVWSFFDEGDVDGADALTCSILAARPALHRTSEDVYEEPRN